MGGEGCDEGANAVREYRVVESFDAYSLAKMVEHFLKAQWQLQGGVSVAPDGFKIRYFQAMVKP